MSRLRTMAATIAVIWGATLPLACQQTQAQGRDVGREALRTGDYQRALAILSTLVQSPAATNADRLALVRVYRETGRYSDAAKTASGFAAEDPIWHVVLGDLAVLRGNLDQAEGHFRTGLDAGGSVAIQSGAHLGRLLLERGKREEAEQVLVGVIRGDLGRLTEPADLAATALALEILGNGWGEPDRFRDALRMYDRAIAADSSNLDVQVALGTLFLTKYNRPDARTTFEAVVRINPKHPGALLGLAQVAFAEGRAEGGDYLNRALETNPHLVEARVALATTHLEREDYAAAELEVTKALVSNPSSLPALTVLAASHLFGGTPAAYDTVSRRVFALNPTYAEFYAQMSVLSARNRFYQQAVDLATRGVALDSISASALAALGLNELRVGAMRDGRSHLERAFVLDPFNVWTKNTLDLLDTFDQYRTQESDTIRVIAAPDEVDLLGPYLRELGELGYRSLAERYGYRPTRPIQLEVYRHHPDFSVRTVGLAGLGALGVSFGNVLAMDSPSARQRGEFNWGSTFWHELTHTFTLGATDHRVPRWFSEGLSVVEERRARPGWGAQVRLGFLKAYEEGKLLPVSRLNDGFVRPTYPEQVGFSYYQASLVCEMIEATRGAEAINRMLDAYRRGLSGPEVFRQALDVEPEAFDKEFDGWFQERFGSALEAVAGDGGGAFHRELQRALASLAAGDPGAAVVAFERAKGLFPEYAERDNPYWHLAKIHREAGRLREAALQLASLTALAESDYAANVEEAEVLEELGDLAGAASALERAVYIDPRDPALHERLAARYGDQERWREAARERQAVLALNPVDKAEAYFQLALAWFQAGERVAARSAVLRALDIAPAFAQAQELLLQIRGIPPQGGLER